MPNFSGECFEPVIKANSQDGLPKSRGLYEHDIDSLDYLSVCEAAKILRTEIYNEALGLFKNSPKMLQQLLFKEGDNDHKNMSLALFNNKFPLTTLNSLSIVKRFLRDRADLLVHPDEKSKIPALLHFVENLMSQELKK
ncbi:MAG: hypothetical protein RBT30_02580 [Patescibacteria group bacterium]|jgi:hypothetical protein|nr:hypothetical protein [Patescibacteria group bacterium]